MTEQWIRENLPLTEEGDVLLARSDWGGIYSVPVGVLAQQFTGVEPSRAALVAHDEAHGYGYRQYVDRWHNEGILPD